MLTTKEASRLWKVSERRVRVLCQKGQIVGAMKNGLSWQIPADSAKPRDGRFYKNKKISEQYLEIFSHIDSKKALLSKHRPLTQGELKRLRDEFLVEFVYDSNAIEGNTLTLQETALVLEGITIDQKPLKEHLEAIGHKEAFLYIEHLVQEKTQLSEKIIKEVHSLILMDRPDDKGCYRRIPVKIMGADFDPTPPLRVPEEMVLLCETYKSKMKTFHALEAIAWFHRKFEKIHPFVDGNGRTGRLLLNFELMKRSYPSINIKYKDRRKYYDAFSELPKMVCLVSEYVEEALNKYVELFM
ncbi:cell division protein Fic [Alphaproteobacteria bacterium]|nr:cell division protein Fic [Alphaproteobacteria bacterium]GHS98545.1 cell division protein Fic [Alphaproteobacteria bacterium]